MKSKINRAVKYYGLSKDNAEKEINRINKQRTKHYNYHTNRVWNDINNYDIAINVDKYGTEDTAEIIKNIVLKKERDD